jgi:integrase
MALAQIQNDVLHPGSLDALLTQSLRSVNAGNLENFEAESNQVILKSNPYPSYYEVQPTKSISNEVLDQMEDQETAQPKDQELTPQQNIGRDSVQLNSGIGVEKNTFSNSFTATEPVNSNAGGESIDQAQGSDRLTYKDNKINHSPIGERSFEPTLDLSGNFTLRQFVNDHYLPFAQVNKRSVKTDISILNNHILPSLGKVGMRSLSPSQVLVLIQGMKEKGLSSSTCNRALILTRFMFNCALKWGVIAAHLENPCRHVKEMVENNKKERFLNREEVFKLKSELAKSRNKFLPYIIQLMILTGCRRGEALNAKLVHFDFGRSDWVVPLPKGGKARHIPLNDLAIQTVRATVAYKQSLSSEVRNSEYLFPSPITGEPFKQIHYSWDKARRAALLEDVRMHDLRHSFASALVNSGMTLYDVKQILGHTNIKTTERYAHLSNERLKAAASSVVSFYGEDNWIEPIKVVSPVTMPTVDE